MGDVREIHAHDGRNELRWTLEPVLAFARTFAEWRHVEAPSGYVDQFDTVARRAREELETKIRPRYADTPEVAAEIERAEAFLSALLGLAILVGYSSESEQDPKEARHMVLVAELAGTLWPAPREG